MPFSNKELKLLIIEDNPGDRLLIKEYLEEEIHRPTLIYASTFAEAKEILRSELSFDAVLLDLTLPDATGNQLVTEMVDIADNCPIVVLTGYSDKAFGFKTLSMGVSDYLLKDDLDAKQLYKSVVYSIERKRIHVQLNKSEEEYRNLFQFSPIPMWLFDVETLVFLNVNAAAIKHYGYGFDEFLSMTVREIRPPEEYHTFEPIVEEYTEAGQLYQGIHKHLKKSGELITVAIKLNVIEIDGRKASLVSAIDITEELAAQELIAKTNEKLQIAQEMGKLGYWELDLNSNNLYWSDEAYRIFGLTRETELTYERFYSHVHPDDQWLFSEAAIKALHERGSSEFEHRIISAGGETKNVYQKASMVYDDQRNSIRLEGIVQDITETTKHLRAIEGQNKKLREIAWTQSHIVRAPLSRIMGLVDLLKNHGTDAEESRELLGHILSSAVELDEVIKKIVKATEDIEDEL